MIFLSRIVPITGVALLGKNLPPTKTSEPAPAKPGAGEHSLANTGEERIIQTLHTSSLFSVHKWARTCWPTPATDTWGYTASKFRKNKLELDEKRGYHNTCRIEKIDHGQTRQNCWYWYCLGALHTERMLYSSEYHALSQNVAINPEVNLRYFGSILH